MMKKGWNKFKRVSDDELRATSQSYKQANPSMRPDEFWINNLYTVQVMLNVQKNGRSYKRAMARRNDAQKNIAWYDLFRIKNELFGEEVEAVQFMPKLSELIDVANIYWIWVENKAEHGGI